MFDIGFGEIFLIAVVALLVLGPERLPKAARFAGLWVRRARAQWYSVKAEFENELADDELKRSLQQTRADLMEARDSLAQGGAALKQQIEQAHTDVRDALEADGAGIDEDIEAPLSSVTDGFEQPELPLDDHDDVDDFEDDGSAEAIPPARSGQDARR
jgi:sec-independent protein translocase protein TatB